MQGVKSLNTQDVIHKKMCTCVCCIPSDMIFLSNGKRGVQWNILWCLYMFRTGWMDKKFRCLQEIGYILSHYKIYHVVGIQMGKT